MSEHVYKTIDLVGTSTNSIEEGVSRALEKASETVRNLRWFQVTEIRGAISDREVEQWQVSLKVGFTLED